MKKLHGTLAVLGAVAVATILCGCTSTQNTIKEYDVDGNLTKETITSESVITSVVNSTKDKTVVMYDNSFLAYVSASTATLEDPTPSFKAGIGKNDKAVLTIHQKHDISITPEIIKQIRNSELEVSATGVSASSSNSTYATDDEVTEPVVTNEETSTVETSEVDTTKVSEIDTSETYDISNMSEIEITDISDIGDDIAENSSTELE